MRTKRRIFCICVTLLGVLLDASVLPYTGLNMHYVPRVCLIIITLIGTVLGSTQGMIFGAVAGILLDITVYTPAGLVAILYTLCGLASGFMSGRMKTSLVTVIPVAAAFLMYEIAMSGAFYISSGFYTGARALYALARIGIGFVLAQILYIPFVKILRPSKVGRGRYIRREVKIK